MVMKKFMAAVFASMTALTVMPITSVSAATTATAVSDGNIIVCLYGCRRKC